MSNNDCLRMYEAERKNSRSHEQGPGTGNQEPHPDKLSSPTAADPMAHLLSYLSECGARGPTHDVPNPARSPATLHPRNRQPVARRSNGRRGEARQVRGGVAQDVPRPVSPYKGSSSLQVSVELSLCSCRLKKTYLRKQARARARSAGSGGAFL